MDFWKYEATGNDFIVVDGTGSSTALSEDAVRDACDRRTGIGADGVIIALPSSVGDLRMRIFNSDGSEAEMCGNGIRALMLFALDCGMVGEGRAEIETPSGIRTVSAVPSGKGERLFAVDMGSPSWRRADIPMSGPPEEEAIRVAIPLDDRPLEATCVSMGNPHCVIIVEETSGYPVKDVGPAVEGHPLFPGRTNVEFAEVEGPSRLKVRFWERGVGETLSCGTGACAALVAARLLGLSDPNATVSVPGGVLEVEWPDRESPVTLKGPARQVFRGTTEMLG